MEEIVNKVRKLAVCDFDIQSGNNEIIHCTKNVLKIKDFASSSKISKQTQLQLKKEYV